MGAALASGASALVAGPAIAAEAAPSPSTSGKLPPAPQAVPSRSITDAGVRHALAGLTASIHETMTRTGIPGVAVAVVYDDKVEYIEGFGVRKAGSTGAVNVNTIFQLASVSKPIASTVISGLVGDGVVGWDDPIVKHLRSFTLKDPWVGSHATIADGFSHRTGLPGHAGDLLDDLGYDRDYILAHLKHEPLDAFRASYAYTNFGLTAGAEAAASAAGKA
jgi:CubicO group peptidase (beta-lactamase class C family)